MISIMERYPWSVLDDLLALQNDFNRVLTGRGMEYPPANAWQSEDALIVDLAVPGIDIQQVHIAVKGNELVVTGKRDSEPAVSDQAYLLRERPTGEFSRTMTLPFRADSEGVKAAYRNGILRITLPKSEEDKPRRIAIEAA
jgi:HSP20 family protein